MEQIIDGFKTEFERFFGLLQAQLEVCPEHLWNKPAGKFIFWQHHLHTLVCTLLFTSSDPWSGLAYDQEMVMLRKLPEKDISKDEMRLLAQQAQAAAQAFIGRQSAAGLTRNNEAASRAMGREWTNQNSLIGLIRHICYHLGCCDTLLREHGYEGVY